MPTPEARSDDDSDAKARVLVDERFAEVLPVYVQDALEPDFDWTARARRRSTTPTRVSMPW